MAAARKRVAAILARVDVVIEMLDARLPEASRNPMIRALSAFRQRPCLKILNKADLADPDATRAWLEFYEAQPGVKAMAFSCKEGDPGKNSARILARCRQIAPHRNTPDKPLRMMIMGIPNVGKSTLMNALLKKRVAAVGDEPAVTKTEQTLSLGKIQGQPMTLTDTPGLLWPKIEIEEDGYMLAASHAVGINAVEPEGIARFLAGLLLSRYPALLAARYRLPLEAVGALDAVAFLETVGARRGCRGKGGGIDAEKTATLFLTEYRGGALGRISLEDPDSRARMLEAKHAAARREESSENEEREGNDASKTEK
jgi:ribosome biogenesis GTPase A